MNALLQASEYLAKGEKSQARALLDPLVFKDPENWRAWLLLSEAVESPYEIRDCLEHALKIAPDQSGGAQKRLAEINARIRNEEKKADKLQTDYQNEVFEGYGGEYRPLTLDQVDAGLELEKQPHKGLAWLVGGFVAGLFIALIAYSVLIRQTGEPEIQWITAGVGLVVAAGVWLIAILNKVIKSKKGRAG